MMASSADEPVERPRPLVRDRQIVGGVVAGVLRNSLAQPGALRPQLLRHVWIELKRFGASNVVNIPLSRIRGIRDVQVSGPVLRHGPLVVCAIASVLECERIFALGAKDVGTCSVLALNLPAARIYRLGQFGPEQIARLRPDQLADANRITELNGASASFDFSPYSGMIDLVHIEGSDASQQVRADTDAAFGLLSELGTIVWDDYTHSPGVYAYLNALAPLLDRPVFHILGTRLAVYSRWDIVIPPDAAP